MNYPEKINTILHKLTQHGFLKDADAITDCQVALGTPGEVFSCIAFHLNNLRKNNSNAYQIVKDEIDDVINYARSINYIQ